MERLVKKYQQKYKKARQEIDRWDALQSQLLKQFQNAAAIVERFRVLQQEENYGALRIFPNIAQDLSAKQFQTLENILLSMQNTLQEFHDVVRSLEKISEDGLQLLKGESNQPTSQQMQMRVGIRPSLSDCLDGLKHIHEMYRSEYLLKLSIVSALSYNTSTGDVYALQAVLSDQPNIPTNEVKYIFDLIYAEELD